MSNFFNLKDIDKKDLKKVGISEKQLLNREEDVAKLLSGKMTGFFKLNLKNPKVSMDAKLSLQRVGNETKLMIHPILREIDKSYNFSSSELDKLNKGEAIPKKIDGKDYLVQQDLETKTIMKVPADKLRLPNVVNGHSLSNEEKLTLMNAGKTKLSNNSTIKIDFNSLFNVTTERQLSVDINKNNEIGR